MKEKKKLKLKKFYFHPVTGFILLTLLVMFISLIMNLLGLESSYDTINPITGNIEKNVVVVENLFSFNGLKYIVSSATTNFVSFTTLSNLLIALIGLGILQASGLIDTFIKRYLVKIDKKIITFMIILLSCISSIINDVGYVILIPLSAIIFHKNNRNPLAGIITAFSGIAFGYGATIFVGSMEVNLVNITKNSARLIDSNYHVPLTSNLIIIIISSILLSIVGTIITEKLIIPKLGRYNNKNENDYSKTQEIEIIEDPEELEQKKLKDDIYEKRGMKYATITAIVFFIFVIYSLIPNLPFSGILLDQNATTYLDQTFGENAYLADGFTFMVTLFFILTGVFYGIGAKTIKNDKELLVESSKYIQEVTLLIPIVFFLTIFVSVFRKTNMGYLVAAYGVNIIKTTNFTGIPLLLLIIIILAITNLFLPTPATKWTIFAPVTVPILMKANITPEFGQFILRATDSMTKGITPLLPYFAIYVGYLNIYNPNKKRPITIVKSIKLLTPYFLIISLLWIAIIIIWYLTNLPIGVNIYPTL